MAATWLVTIGWQYSLSVLGLWVIWLCALVLPLHCLAGPEDLPTPRLPHLLVDGPGPAHHQAGAAPSLVDDHGRHHGPLRHHRGCSTLDAGLADEGLGYGDVVISQLGATAART